MHVRPHGSEAIVPRTTLGHHREVKTLCGPRRPTVMNSGVFAMLSPIVRCALAISAAVVLAWLIREPWPLLGAVAAVSIYFGRWPALLSIATFALTVGVVSYVSDPNGFSEFKTYSRSAALLIAALAVGLGLPNRSVLPNGTEDDARLIVEKMPGLAWSTDPSGNFKYVNQSVLDYVGVPPDDLNRVEGLDDFGWRAVVHPDDADRAIGLWLHCLRTGEPYESEHRIRRFDGSYRWFRAVGRSSHDSRDRITGWYGTTIDIDARKQMEEALRNSEQQLRLLIDTIPALVWCATPDGEPSYLNKRLMDYIGLTLESFDGTSNTSRRSAAMHAVVHPDDIQKLDRGWTHSVITGGSFGMQFRLRRADGVFRWVDSRGEPLRDDHGSVTCWYCVNVDIDDATRMQDALRSTSDGLARASQAASLAEMSASIAHEVNQPLAAVVANSYACKQWLSTEPANIDRARITMDRVIRDANSAADVVSRTRALFKRRASIKRPLQLNTVISEVLQLMSDEIAANAIYFQLDLSSDLPSIAADRVQIQQVFVNLLRNGIEAMQSADYSQRSLSVRCRPNGSQMILVQVQDRGSGLSDMDRAFEPFFTTKDDGIGMGLAICRSIIEAHNGRLWAEKSGHEGTIFSFTLPVHDDVRT